MMLAGLYTWGVPLVLLLLALLLVLPLLRQWRKQRRMEKRISSVGFAQLKNVLLDDGMGGQSFFERLLLTPNGLLLLLSNRRDGIIFGGERMDTWAQVLGNHTIRFTNPLYQIENQLATLRFHLPKVPVVGNVMFTGDCSFPKGKPHGIQTMDDLAVAGSDEQHEIAPSYQQAWEAIGQRARAIDPVRDAYLLPVKEGASPLRAWLALVLAGLALVWPLWFLFRA